MNNTILYYLPLSFCCTTRRWRKWLTRSSITPSQLGMGYPPSLFSFGLRCRSAFSGWDRVVTSSLEY